MNRAMIPGRLPDVRPVPSFLQGRRARLVAGYWLPPVADAAVASAISIGRLWQREVLRPL